MYNEFFGFTQLPFAAREDTYFFYSNPVYQGAFTGLRYGVKLRKGLMVMTGEAGTGKTTLLRLMAARFESHIHTALIMRPNPGFAELLRLMLIDFGVNPPKGRDRMIRALTRYSTDQIQKDHVVAVFIDDAQHLESRTLKELAFLSDLEVDNKKLLQIVLAGRPELATRLEHPALQSVRKRVALWHRLTPLSGSDVARYITYRLTQAGYQGEALFPQKAVALIASYGKGIPHLTNIICHNALLAAYNAGQKNISPQIIHRVYRDLQAIRESLPTPAIASSRFHSDEHLPWASESRKPASKTAGGKKLGKTDADKWDRPAGEFTTGIEINHRQISRTENSGRTKIAAVVVLVIVVASAALLYSGWIQRFGLEPYDLLATRQTWKGEAGNKFAAQTSTARAPVVPSTSQQSELSQSTKSHGLETAPQPEEFATQKLAGGLSSEQSSKASTIQPTANREPFSSPAGEVGPSPLRDRQPAPRQPPLHVGAKVYVHTSQAGDRSVVDEIGQALRIHGYTIPDTRFTAGRTQGDVRFFFPQDRRDAARVKSVVESELERRGYRISLQLLERDGRKFRFAAPGNIEVWLPPLPKA
jgi:general secretion pathway protein A